MNYLLITSQFLHEAFVQIVLGFLQGITEFLPISSTAHLMVVPLLLGWKEPSLSVIASLQLGSILAVLIYFWSDLCDVLKGLTLIFREKNYNNSNSTLALSLLLGNIPIVLVGLGIKFFWVEYEDSFLRSIPSIGIVSILMSVLLALSERIGSRRRTSAQIKVSDGILVGFSQILALVPGVSRSGITISSSLLVGFERATAARFSFLLGIPAITLAGLVEIKDLFMSENSLSVFTLIIGITTASITSWFSIDILIKFLQRFSTMVFVYYRLFFGSFILIWFFH